MIIDRNMGPKLLIPKPPHLLELHHQYNLKSLIFPAVLYESKMLLTEHNFSVMG